MKRNILGSVFVLASVIFILVLGFTLAQFVKGDDNVTEEGFNKNKTTDNSPTIIEIDETSYLSDKLQFERELIKNKLQYLDEKEKKFDSFVFVVTLIIGLFTLFVAAVLGLGWFFNSKDIKEMKAEIHAELKTDLDDKVHLLTKSIMKSNYEEPISDLQSRTQFIEGGLMDLRDWIQKRYKKLKVPILKFDVVESKKEKPRNEFENG